MGTPVKIATAILSLACLVLAALACQPAQEPTVAPTFDPAPTLDVQRIDTQRVEEAAIQTIVAMSATAQATPLPPTATAAQTTPVRPAATAQTGAQPPTPTPEAPGPGTPQSIIPTVTPAPPTPTVAPRPTATPYPTPRPLPASAQDDICYRTPGVQKAILNLMGAKYCAAIATRELYRVTTEDFEVAEILHPDDLLGFENLIYLGYEFGPLDYLNLSHTPNLKSLHLEKVESWPEDFTLDGLSKLEWLRVNISNEATCQTLMPGTIKRIFGTLATDGRLNLDDKRGTERLRLSINIHLGSLGWELDKNGQAKQDGAPDWWNKNDGSTRESIRNRITAGIISELGYTDEEIIELRNRTDPDAARFDPGGSHEDKETAERKFNQAMRRIVNVQLGSQTEYCHSDALEQIAREQ